MRSALDIKFQDIIVSIETRNGNSKATVRLKDEEPPMLLQHYIVNNGVILGLMREPLKDDGLMSLFL